MGCIFNIQSCLGLVGFYQREEEVFVCFQKLCTFHVIHNLLTNTIKLARTVLYGKQRGGILVFHCQQRLDCNNITPHRPYIVIDGINILSM